MDPAMVPNIEAETASTGTTILRERFSDLANSYLRCIPNVPAYDADAVYTRMMITYRELRKRGQDVKLPWQ